MWKSVFTLLSLLTIAARASDSKGMTKFDGVSPELRVESIRFSDGKGALHIEDIDKPDSDNFFIMLWLKVSEPKKIDRQWLLDFPSDLGVYFERSQLKIVQGGSSLTLETAELQAERWVHLAISGSKSQDKTYAVLSYNDQVYTQQETSYFSLKLSKGEVYLGNSDSVSESGFKGNVREFLIADQYLQPENLLNIRNQIFEWNLKVLAYYRFRTFQDQFYSTRIATKMNSARDLLNFPVPEKVNEEAINDICLQPTDSLKLPYLENTDSFPTYNLGTKYQREQNDYEYTFSTWVKFDHDSPTESDRFKAVSRSHFLRLGEVFYCYLTSPGRFACVIESRFGYQVKKTSTLTVPTGQWVNIQLAFSRYKGYNLKVYNYLRQQMQSTTSSKSLGVQQPDGKLQIFDKFVGQVRDLVLYEKRFSLPILTPKGSGSNSDMFSSSLLFYINMDESNFDKEGNQYNIADEKSLKIIKATRTLEFDFVSWSDEYEFGGTYTAGTLNSEITLFDGLACNDWNLTPQTQESPDSSISYTIPGPQDKLNQLSVQFWFLKEKTQDSSYTLFQLQSVLSEQLYMTISVSESGDLQCQPQDQSGSLDFTHYKQETKQWYNIMCMYSETVENFGTLFTTQTSTLNIYSGPLSSSFTQFQSGEYNISLGNKIKEGQSTAEYTFFKEVRVYSQTFETEEVKKTLFTQLYSSYPSTLLSYMRLNSGSQYFYDQINPSITTQSKNIVNKTPMIEESDDVFQICPMHTYYSQFNSDGQCLQNPFNSVPRIYSFFSSTSELTLSAKYSDMLAEESHLTYNWQVSYQALFDLQLEDQVEQSEMVVQTDRVNGQGYGDQLQYTWDLAISNELRSFQSSSTSTFALKRCRWLSDSQSNESQNENLLPDVRGQEDIQFQFSVKEREDEEACDQGGFYEILKEVKIELFPSELYLQAGLTLDQVVTIEKVSDLVEEEKEEEEVEEEEETPAENDNEEEGENTENEEEEGEGSSEEGDETEPSEEEGNSGDETPNGESDDAPQNLISGEEKDKEEGNELGKEEEETEDEINSEVQDEEENIDSDSQEEPIEEPIEEPVEEPSENGRRLQELTGDYVITLKKEFQVLLDLKQPFYIITTLDWQKSEEEPEQIAQQSIAYTLEFIHSIKTIVKTESDVLLNGEQLFIDGSETFLETDLNQATNQQGISYEWHCHEDFKLFCKEIFGNQLTLEFEQFQKLTGSKYNQEYVFELVAWHTSDFERKQEFSEEVTITWLDYEFPIFELTDWNKPFSYSKNVNILEIILENYSFLDPNLEIQWTIEPEISSDLLKYSPNNAQLFLNKDSIVADQEYKITTVVKNTLAQKSQTTKTYTFVSSLAPQPGQTVLEPNSGIRSETLFTLKIQRWTSNNSNIKFRVWTSMPDIYGKTDFLVQLSQDWILQTEAYDTLFPYLTEIIYEISDDSGSTQFKPRTVVIEEPFAEDPRENFNREMAAISELTGTNLEQAFFKLKLLCYSLRQFDVINGEETYRNQENRQNILEFYQKYLQSLDEKSFGDRTEIILKGIIEGLPFVFNSFTWINDKIMSEGIEILERLKVPQIEWKKLIVQEVYREHYLEAFNNIMGYVQLKQKAITENSQGRRLQLAYGTTSEEDILVSLRKLLDIEKLFSESQCENAPIGELWITETDQSETQILKFSYETLQETQAFTNQDETLFTILPVKKALDSLPQDGQVFCLQVSFFKIDPLLGTEITDLELISDQFIQNNYIVNSEEYSLQDLFPKEELQNTALEEDLTKVELREAQTVYFTYNYEEQRIRKNQTMCMYLVLTEQRTNWFPDNCLTTYLQETDQIKCQCRVIGANSYLSLIRNETRIEVDPEPVPEEILPTYIYERDEKVYIIIIFFLALMIPGTCCCWCIDSIDYNHIQDPLKEEDDIQFFTKLAKIRKQAYEVVIYKKYLATVFRSKEEDKLQGSYLYFTLLRNLHPFFSLFLKFDSRHRRITRLVSYLFQISLVTLLILLQFGENPREATDRTIDEMDTLDMEQAIGMGLIYAFLLLPLPQSLQNKFCKAKFTKHSRFKEQHMEDANYQDTDMDIEQTRARENNPTQTNLKRDDELVERALQNEKIIMTDNCLPFKLLFILATWSFAFYVILYVRDQSPELSQAQDDTLFTSWMVAIVASLFLHNPLRLLFATCLLEGVVKAEKNGEPKSCIQMIGSFLFVPLEAKKLYIFYDQVKEADIEVYNSKKKGGFAQKIIAGGFQDKRGRSGSGKGRTNTVDSSRHFKEDM